MGLRAYAANNDSRVYWPLSLQEGAQIISSFLPFSRGRSLLTCPSFFEWAPGFAWSAPVFFDLPDFALYTLFFFFYSRRLLFLP